MPEGPELHLAAQFVRNVGRRHVFTGAVVKSEVSLKNPDVPWNKKEYKVDAISRGKEMKILLKDVKSSATSSILFHFGMSGKFEWTTVDDLPKHAHLRFFAKQDNMVLSFVDYRRFGRWFLEADWSPDRGPCVVTEPQLFRQNVLDHLEDKAFDKPLCEAMLNQKYFNGVGNYLRAEVLFRLKIRPFERARTVLTPLVDDKSELKQEKQEVKNNGKTKEPDIKVEAPSNEVQQAKGKRKTKGAGKIAKKEENRDTQDVKPKIDEVSKNVVDDVVNGVDSTKKEDILDLTHQLAKEVVGLGFDGGYFSETRDKWESGFGQWLQCYFKEGMSNVKDHNGRTMWFQGEAGPMAPTGFKRGVGKKGKKEDAGEEESASPKKVKKEMKKKGKGTKEETQPKKRKSSVKKEKENVVKNQARRSVKAETKPGVRRSGRLSNANV